MSAFLSAEDVRRITGKKRYSAQRRVLDARHIRYTQAENGEPLVRESDLDAKEGPARNRGPNWDRIGA